jgi:succinyl-CoA synthetase beta subunit
MREMQAQRAGPQRVMNLLKAMAVEEGAVAMLTTASRNHDGTIFAQGGGSYKGTDPANFLDVGGTANAERVEKAFKIILKDEKVKAILVNIFGGIVRCDRVAQGIVDAYKNIGDIKIPIIVRLQGTNAEEAKKIINESGLKVFSAIQLQEAADLVKDVVKG